MNGHHVLVAALALPLVACSPSGVSQNDAAENLSGPAKPKTRQPRQFDGWGAFKFGMSFDDAIIAETGIRWDGESFRTCRDEMPIRGCTLWAADDSYAPLITGVALLPHLSFNQKAELTTVDMTKRLRGTVTPAQCERAHGQLLDYLDAEWGPGKSREKLPGDMLERTTPKGRTFYRSPREGSVFVLNLEDFNKLPDGRKVTIISHYTAANEYSEADCWLSIYFDGPKSLERPPSEPVEEASE